MAPTSSPTGTSPIGREAELAQLRDVAYGRGAVAAILRGDPGMGKSTVLEALVDGAPDPIRVRQDAARQLEQHVPYALITELFELRPQAPDPLQASLGRLLVGDDRGPDGNVDPYALVLGVTEGIIDLLLRGSGGGNDVLVVDDLHWADRPSLLIFDRLVRRAPQLALRLVLSTRPTRRIEVQAVIDRVASAGGIQIQLEPLSEDEAVQMMADMLGAPPGPNLTTLIRGAAGNPLYLAELGRAALEDGTLLRRGQMIDLQQNTAPSSFRTFVLERLSTFPPDTVAALRTAAVLGTDIDVPAVAAVTGWETLYVLETLDPASLSGLVVDRGGSLTFRHELVRGALYSGLPEAARRDLHRTAARALSDPAAIAAQLEAAGPPFTEADLALLRLAADVAQRVDAGRAVALLETVLENTAPSPERVEVRAQHAEALVMSGDLEGAFAALLALTRDGFGTDIRVGRAMLEAQGARDQPDPDLVDLLQRQAPGISDEPARLDLLGVIAYHAARADPPRFHDLLEGLPNDGPELPIDARVHFLLAHALRRGADGDLFAAIEAARSAYTLAQDGGASPQPAVRAALTLGVFGGDLQPFRAEAIEALQDATRWAEDSRQTGMIAIAHALLANAYWARGDWDEAEAAYRTCVVAAEEAEVPRWRAEALFLLSAIAADRGDIEAARDHFGAWEAVGWDLRPTGHGGAAGGAGRGWMRPAALEARIAFGAGRDEEAISAWTRDVRDADTVPFGKAISAMDLAVAALFAGDRKALERAEEALRPLEGEGPPIGMVRPLVDAARRGDVETAVRIAEQARITPVYGFAKMAEIAGLVARDTGDHHTAVRWLGESSEAWRACGAVALERRTAAALRALGVRSRGRIRERPVSGWESLSDAETLVVGEAAKGLLYREVAERLHLSRRTVETHVASAIRKLQLRNRIELAAEYWKRQPA